MIESLFLKTRRVTGNGSRITVIEPGHYLEFFAQLKANSTMALEFKAFLAIAVSGGCRVTEALSVKVSDIEPSGQFRVKVLKKRRAMPVYRPCMLSPDAFEMVQAYIASLSSPDKLFSMHRTTVHRHIKKHFGSQACSHSIARHSHISWLLHNLNITTAKVAAEMRMQINSVDSYNHANIEVEQTKRFKGVL